jgi:signal transduction histidine kinase
LRSEALRSGTLDAATSHQHIEEIDDEVVRLSGLVNDLLLLSRLDARQAEVGSEHIDPTRLARSAIAEIASLVETKRISLYLSISDNLPEITATSSHLYTVLRNLLDNAIKYTPEGGEITCSLCRDGQGLRIAVMDNGRGIEPAELPNVTKRFYRADKARTRSIPGTGLGLSLVDSIVAYYGGSMQVESEGLGCGTAVYVHWPSTPMRRGGEPDIPDRFSQ